jgi:hypothetical protein
MHSSSLALSKEWRVDQEKAGMTHSQRGSSLNASQVLVSLKGCKIVLAGVAESTRTALSAPLHAVDWLQIT